MDTPRQQHLTAAGTRDRPKGAEPKPRRYFGSLLSSYNRNRRKQLLPRLKNRSTRLARDQDERDRSLGGLLESSRRRYVVQRMYHDERWGLTGEGASQGLPFHLIASFSTGESCEVPEGCCCRLRWGSGRSEFCNRSSLIEPGFGANILLYLRFDDVTGGATGSVLCSLVMPAFPHKMVDLPSKMADVEKQNGRLFSALLG